MRFWFPNTVVVALALFLLTGCGTEESVPPAQSTAPATPPPQNSATPAPNNATPTGFGFGPVTLRIIGTAPKPGAGTKYVGDCDNKQPDDDFEVMTFSAPWKIVGSGSAGAGAGLGSPASRSFIFEKHPDFGEKRFELVFGRELSRATVESLTVGLTKVTDIAFGAGSVGLFFVPQTGELSFGYAAFFPIAVLTGLPPEPEFTSRYVARVSFTPVGPLDFDGWSQAEVVQLYESLYTERCLGEQMGSAFAGLGATTEYE